MIPRVNKNMDMSIKIECHTSVNQYVYEFTLLVKSAFLTCLTLNMFDFILTKVTVYNIYLAKVET